MVRRQLPASHIASFWAPKEEATRFPPSPSGVERGRSACHRKILFNYDFLKGETEIHRDKRRSEWVGGGGGAGVLVTFKPNDGN